MHIIKWESDIGLRRVLHIKYGRVSKLIKSILKIISNKFPYASQNLKKLLIVS